jgi:hypothetical protein
MAVFGTGFVPRVRGLGAGVAGEGCRYCVLGVGISIGIIVKSTPKPFYRPITDIASEVPTDASSASGVALPWRVEISLPWRVV